MALEFVPSQLCTWYRMFSEAAGLVNNETVPSQTLPPCLPGVLPPPTNLLPPDLNLDSLLSHER